MTRASKTGSSEAPESEYAWRRQRASELGGGRKSEMLRRRQTPQRRQRASTPATEPVA